MNAYVSRRLGALLFVLAGVTVLSFSLGHVAPGDPAHLALQRILGTPPTDAEVEQMRQTMGLDRPIPVQYVTWLNRALHGDLGTSWSTGRPVSQMLIERLPRTAVLAAAALGVGLALGIPFGIAAAHYRNRWIDHGSRLGGLVGASFPNFFVAYLLMFIFGVKLNLLPVFGTGSWRHLVLPAVTLGVGATAILMRLTRSSLLEVIREPYVDTARAKGASQTRVLFVHAFRTALLAIVSVIGLRIGFLLTGTVIIEWVFAWPGLGKLAVDGIYARDYPVVQGFVLLTGTVFVLINLLTDLAYAWVDPRVRLQGE